MGRDKDGRGGGFCRDTHDSLGGEAIDEVFEGGVGNGGGKEELGDGGKEEGGGGGKEEGGGEEEGGGKEEGKTGCDLMVAVSMSSRCVGWGGLSRGRVGM